jgi:YegS/Rv2252/BmrU family lipid kinase
LKKKQHIRFIVNPFSGVRKKQRLDYYLKKYLDKNRFDYEICFTKAPGHAIELAKEALQNFDIIVAVGGDGSVNEVSNALIGSDKILGVIPTGSGNGFARHLGISRHLKNAIKYLNTAEVLKIDTCQLNDRKYVNIAGVGFPAWVAFKSKTSKFRGFLGYLKTSLIETCRYQMQSFSIKINGNEIKRDCLCIEVANASMFGYNMKIASKASLTDGLLDVVLIKKVPKWRYLFSMWRFATGTVHKSSLVETFSAKSVEIIPDTKCSVHVDGEGFLSDEPLKFSVNQLSLNVLKHSNKSHAQKK